MAPWPDMLGQSGQALLATHHVRDRVDALRISGPNSLYDVAGRVVDDLGRSEN
jgi:hypothetical protein